LQRLNSIEASSRAKINFLEALFRFHSQQGNGRITVPSVNHKSLDLWLLRKEVQKLGGYDTVRLSLIAQLVVDNFAGVEEQKVG
jgi:[histone H3]-trimethyl-L-lysine4 demethylase